MQPMGRVLPSHRSMHPITGPRSIVSWQSSTQRAGLRLQVLGLQLGPLVTLTDMGSQVTATGELTQANGALPTQGELAVIPHQARGESAA